MREVGEVGERGLEGGEEEVDVHPRQVWGVHRWWGGEGAGGRVRLTAAPAGHKYPGGEEGGTCGRGKSL